MGTARTPWFGTYPFPSTFAAFLTRAADFVRMLAISNVNVKLAGSHAGVSIGEDGPSQMALEDLAMMRPIMGSTVFYPCDAVSAERLVEEAIRVGGVVYLRTSRPKTKVIYGPDERFPAGGSKVLRSSAKDVATVVGAGITVFEALAAYEALAKEGIAIRVVDAYSIKPIDAEAVRAAARDCGAIVTVEDHAPEGGLGDAVLEALAEGDAQAHVVKLAVREIPGSGTPEELLHGAKIDADAIADAAQRLVATPA